MSAGPTTPVAMLRGARAALVFLTRLPAGGFPYAPAEWKWAAAWFPLVGAAVGGVSAAAWALGRPAGPLVAGAIAVAAALLITGALHEDGLADTADALGGGHDREQVLAILKDPRIGVFGAAALVMALLLRVALLARLDEQAPIALVLVGACARTPPVWLMVALPYVTPAEASRSRPLIQTGPTQALGATLAAAAVIVIVALPRAVPGQAVLAMLAVAIGITLVGAWRFRARVGGITGDFLGAVEQAAEVGMLLALALVTGSAGAS